MINGLGHQNLINNYSVSKNVKGDTKIDNEQVTIGGNQSDNEIQKADNLREMHEKSSLWDNLKDFAGGILIAESKPATVMAVLGTVVAGGAAVALGTGALVAIGAGAIGFTVGGFAGLVYDLKHHLM
jgi:hypothetical protein